MSILGLHHVTATVAGAQEDLDFYVGILGLRLVKKTVNFDNHGVYHFYYGTELGAPGTLMTTFPYAGMGVREGAKGAGQVTVTSFSVPGGSLDRWRSRLDEHGVIHGTGPGPGTSGGPGGGPGGPGSGPGGPGGEHTGGRFGEEVLSLVDPSGLDLELVAVSTGADAREPWTGGSMEAGMAIRGLHSVTLTIREPDATIGLLTGALGYDVVAEEGRRTRLAAGGEGPGHYVDVLHAPHAAPAVNGLGTVHHVAMAIADAESQLALREELLGHGLSVTDVRDRQYFRSIYFREPGGVLYEVATLPPGFTVDEEPHALGGALRLPPDAERERRTIEAALPEVRIPG